MPNINDSFFEGHYKHLWKTVIPDELTTREIDFMLPYFGLKEGSRVLDLMCGYGRHALALARKGIAVTAVDNLPAYLDEIDETAAREGLKVHTRNENVTEFRSTEKFELAICMGNSLQFFEASDIGCILSSVNDCLVPGGKLLINSWSIAEIVLKNFRDRSWSQIGDYKFLVESAWKFSPSRVEIKSIILTPDGETEEKNSVDYVYSINEMENMLKQSGFVLEEVYSIPGRKKFALGEPRAYFVAKRV